METINIMGTINNSGGSPLVSPGQLKQIQVAPPTQKTDSSNVLGKGLVSQLLTPDQLKQQSNGNVGVTPNLSIYNRPPSPPVVKPQVQPTTSVQPKAQLTNMAHQLKGLMKSADAQILSQFDVQIQKDTAGNIVKDAQGKVSYMVDNKPVSHAELQRHLLPQATVLHQQLNRAQAYVETQYNSFVGALNSNLSQMSPTEQTSMGIQSKAVKAIYMGFLDRLNQVDRLIR